MKNILLAVTGLSPQVITETLYALHQNAKKVDAIHVITTRDGKDMIYSGLLGGENGYFHRYLEDYDIDHSTIDLSHENIHVVHDEYGVEVPDIASEADNENLLRKCLDLTFHLTRDPESAVFFSVAGGRKTMSSCLTLAAQMYGRRQDRLYHVLVSPEFENNRDFFYPPREPRVIELKDQQGQTFYKDSSYARIELVPIPFFSIRDHLAGDFLKQPKDPGTLMLSLIREEKQHLAVNLIDRKIIYRTIELDMMPTHLALYAFFAMRKKNCAKDGNHCGPCTECFIDIQTIYEKQDEITEIYKKVSRGRPVSEMSDSGITSLNAPNFNMYNSKIRNQLLKRFGLYALKDLEIASLGTKPNTRYGIMMDKGSIEVVF